MQLPTGKSDTRPVRNFKKLLRENVRLARGTAPFSSRATDLLASITKDFQFSFKAGELQIINGNWYVTHTGLLRLSRRRKCSGIDVEAVDSLCDSAASRFVLKATVYPSKGSSGFVGYGDRRIQGLGETARSSGRCEEPVTLPVSSWPTLLEPPFWQFRGVVRRSTCAFARSPLTARDERREDLSVFSPFVGLNLIPPLTRKSRTYLTMLDAKLMLGATHGGDQ